MFKNLNIHTIFAKRLFRNNITSIFEKHEEYKHKMAAINVNSLTISVAVASIYFFMVFSILTIKFSMFSTIRTFLNLDFLTQFNSPTFILFSLFFGFLFTFSTLSISIFKYFFFKYKIDIYLNFLSKPENFIPLLSNQIFISHSSFYQDNIVKSLISKQLTSSDINNLFSYYQNTFNNHVEPLSEQNIFNTVEHLKSKINSELQPSSNNNLQEKTTNIKFFNSDTNN